MGDNITEAVPAPRSYIHSLMHIAVQVLDSLTWRFLTCTENVCLLHNGVVVSTSVSYSGASAFESHLECQLSCSV